MASASIVVGESAELFIFGKQARLAPVSLAIPVMPGERFSIEVSARATKEVTSRRHPITGVSSVNAGQFLSAVEACRICSIDAA